MDTKEFAELSKVLSHLQTVCTHVGCDVSEKIQIPQIVVIGSQSAGKSSVLEAVVGWDFLPRGTGIVTRRPLVLSMMRMTPEEEKQREAAGQPVKYAEFDPEPGSKDGRFVTDDFLKVRSEIERRTQTMCGAREVKNLPIRLVVKSPQLFNLTLVDLPGLTKVAVEGQSDTIADDIRNMALEWIRPQKSIVLAVTAANTDIASSDSLQLAKTVDPNGERTLGVLTKLDLMDAGTDCLPTLTGKLVKLKLGFIGVRNRSQQEINQALEMKKAQDAERQYFLNHPSYRPLAERLGTPYLTQTLAKLLHKHILAALPELKKDIQDVLEQCNAQLRQDGEDESNTPPETRMLHLLTSYREAVFNCLNGGQAAQASEDGVGRGAKISDIFNGYVRSLDKMKPIDDISDEDISLRISTSAGVRNHLFFQVDAFESLVRGCIDKLEHPSLKCTQYVHDQMNLLACEASTVFTKYPVLKEQVEDFTKKLIEEDREELDKHVRLTVNIQKARINTRHPQFFNGGRNVKEMLRSLIGGDAEGQVADAQAGSMPMPSHVDPNDDGRVADGEIKAVRNLTKGYFEIVKQHMQHSVPGSVMHFMIDSLNKRLNSELVKAFYGAGRGDEEYFEKLMCEDADVVKRRQAVKLLAKTLKESLATLSSLRTMTL